MLKRALITSLLLLPSLPAIAECTGNETDDALNACLAQDLRDSDKRINAVYKSLMDSLDDGGKTALRDEQRRWLKQRDKACALDNKESDREKWLAGILKDHDKTLCVVRHTFGRVSQLDEIQKLHGGKTPDGTPDAPRSPQFAKAPPTPAADESERGIVLFDEGYAAASMIGHNASKWYFEVTVDPDAIAAAGDLLLQVGYASNELNMTNMLNVRRNHPQHSTVNIGVAIDLDNGFVYMRRNGEWNQQPGSTASPMMVKLNREYRAYLRGSSSVEDLLYNGMIKVNLGSAAFRYALPDGYRPFNGA
jgi:uncharacterized protein YecT (DUF1311 family)